MHPHLDPADYWLEGNAMAMVRERLCRAATGDLPVLVYGPLGSDRARVASWLHRRAHRRGHLIRFSCAANDGQADRELFGYQERLGLVEAADGGTLYLDDIAKLPTSAQGRLLRLLEDRESRRVEGTESIPVELRMVAGTRHDLGAVSRQGGFLEELLLCLDGVQLHIPPLSQRSQPELRELVDKLLRRESAHHGLQRELKLSRSAMKALLSHSWPGNMQELENSLRRAVALHDVDSGVIEANMLELYAAPGVAADQAAATQQAAVTTRSMSEELSLEEYFQRFILEHQGAMSETKLARKLGISRKCLWERRQRFGIPRRAGSQKRAASQNHAATTGAEGAFPASAAPARIATAQPQGS